MLNKMRPIALGHVVDSSKGKCQLTKNVSAEWQTWLGNIGATYSQILANTSSIELKIF